MGNDRPIKVKCWEAFLKFRGCNYHSTEASHDKWKCPGCFQSIIFWGNKKEIPFAHIKTNLATMKVDKADFWAWVNANC
jgi:hypothetical protein